MKATICVDVEAADEVAAVDAWFTRWRDRLAFCSENAGCGCCVDIWEVDAPSDALAELPASVVTAGEWSTSVDETVESKHARRGHGKYTVGVWCCAALAWLGSLVASVVAARDYAVSIALALSCASVFAVCARWLVARSGRGGRRVLVVLALPLLVFTVHSLVRALHLADWLRL